jgi:cation diffusion facilitator family transporter
LIKIFIRKFIKNYEKIKDRKVRENYIKLSGTIGIICNLILFIIKISIGFFINSIAVISDAFNNMTDIGSSLVSIFSAKLSNRPPDVNHPHGHGRYEYIGSLVVAFIIFSVGFELLRKSYDKLINPEKIYFNTAILIILILSVMIKLWMFSYNLYIAKTINSSINKATAYDSFSDIIATSLVILSMVIGFFYNLPIDGAVGIVIALLIMYSGFDVAKDTINLLLGSAPDPQVVERINQIVNSGDGVLEAHDLEIHDYGPGRVVASIHAEVPDFTNIVKAHSSIDVLEKQIMDEAGINITIHIDPISTDTRKVEKIKGDIFSCVNLADMGIQIHNIRVAQAETKVIVIFDLNILKEVPETDYCDIKNTIREKIEGTFSNYEVVIDRIT